MWMLPKWQPMPPWIRLSRALPSSSICERYSPRKSKESQSRLLMWNHSFPQGQLYPHTQRPSVKRQRHLARRKSPPTAVGESTGAAPVQLPVCLEDAMQEDLTKTNEQRHDWIEQRGRPQREVTRGSYRRLADFVVSTTDPDATLMPDLWGGTPFGLPHALRCSVFRHHHPDFLHIVTPPWYT
jgi:hypothetical protein